MPYNANKQGIETNKYYRHGHLYFHLDKRFLIKKRVMGIKHP